MSMYTGKLINMNEEQTLKAEEYRDSQREDGMQGFIDSKLGKKKICANHPVSTWREGYARCYAGWKLDKECVELEEVKHE